MLNKNNRNKDITIGTNEMVITMRHFEENRNIFIHLNAVKTLIDHMTTYRHIETRINFSVSILSSVGMLLKTSMPEVNSKTTLQAVKLFLESLADQQLIETKEPD